MKPRFVEPLVLVLSAVAIAYQVVLMRVFSIAQWHHFAYMIISIAMLGFGASGTVLALVRKRVEGRENPSLLLAAAASAVSFGLCFAAAQRIPFDTYRIVRETRQLGYLLGLYGALAVPFFLTATVIALSFMANPRRIGRLYGVNMLGSGLGALSVPLLLTWAPPARLPWVLSAVAGLAAAAAAVRFVREARTHLLPVAMAVYTCMAAAIALHASPADLPVGGLRISEYKSLAYALQLPDAEIVAETSGPLSVLTAVRSEQIRETPGQVSNYPWGELGPFPEQIGLYYDAGAVSPVHRFDGDMSRFAFLDYVTSALPYHLGEPEHVAVLGSGGGTDVLNALSHGASQVTAVEADRNVVRLVQEGLGDFSGGLYGLPEVRVAVADARQALRTGPARYDLIHLPLFGGFGASTAGVLALNESYLYTLEAFELFLSRLEPRGMLALDCWLKTPPRNAIKLFATAVEACERAGFVDPGDHLFFIRSWNTATICVSAQPFTHEQVAAGRTFCRSRGFDVCHYPGMLLTETNRYTMLERPVYTEAAQAVLSPHRQAFYGDYLFCIRPATDDQPYFFRFFKWGALPRLMHGMGVEWAPFVEWGYITLLMTLTQSLVAGAALVALPMCVGLLRRSRMVRPPRGARRWTVAYFATLGLAYMFLEIVFIQRFVLFLASPVHAVAVVLTALLVFSGLGALVSGAATGPPRTKLLLAAAGIVGAAGIHALALPALFHAAAAWPLWAKSAVSIASLALPAFCMGIPFPAGLQYLSDRSATLVPWAWSVNGCASVVGATLATVAAVHGGFRLVVLAAALMYLFSVYVFIALRTRLEDA